MDDQTHEPAEFQIDEIYSVPGVGTVVSGTCYKGRIQMNDTLLLGPDLIGQFRPVIVKGVHRKRMPVKEVRSGQTASFALKKIKRSELRKGMYLLSEKLHPSSSWEFEGEILVLHHPTTISVNYQAMGNLNYDLNFQKSTFVNSRFSYVKYIAEAFGKQQLFSTCPCST